MDWQVALKDGVVPTQATSRIRFWVHVLFGECPWDTQVVDVMKDDEIETVL